jgi:hypothetical protein
MRWSSTPAFLVPIVLADTLLRIVEKGLYRPLWSERILGEAQAAIEEIHPGIDLQKRFPDTREAFDDARSRGGKNSKPGSSYPTTMTATLSPQPSGRTPRPS